MSTVGVTAAGARRVDREVYWGRGRKEPAARRDPASDAGRPGYASIHSRPCRKIVSGFPGGAVLRPFIAYLLCEGAEALERCLINAMSNSIWASSFPMRSSSSRIFRASAAWSASPFSF